MRDEDEYSSSEGISSEEESVLNEEIEAEVEFDDDEGGQDEDGVDSKFRAWGNKANDYYAGSQDEDDGDDDSEEEMAEEALVAAEKSRLRLLRRDDSLQAFETDSADEAEIEANAKTIADFMAKPLNDVQVPSAQEVEEASPELVPLLADFKRSSEEVKQKLLPLIRKLKAVTRPDCKDPECLTFLEAKSQLLLNYLTNLSFYFLLKSKGQRVRDHPVIKQLSWVRSLLEKIQPIEAKLAHKIEKLIRDGDNHEQSEKPSLEGFDESIYADEDEGDDDSNCNKTKGLKFITSSSRDGEEREKSSLAKSIDFRNFKKNSELVKALREEFGDEPPVIGEGDDGDDDDTSSKGNKGYSKHREEFEEENFIRLAVTKQDRQALRKELKKKRFESAGIARGEDLDALGDDIIGTIAEEAENRRKAFSSQLNSAQQISRKAARNSKGGDELVDFTEKKRRAKKVDSNEAELARARERGITKLEIEPEIIAAEKLASQKKRELKMQMMRETAVSKHLPRHEEEADAGDKRLIGYDIHKNKGLIRKRKKEDRNARVKNKNKFDRAVKRRKGQVQDSTKEGNDDGGYSGEATGIKKNVMKSTRIF